MLPQDASAAGASERDAARSAWLWRACGGRWQQGLSGRRGGYATPTLLFACMPTRQSLRAGSGASGEIADIITRHGRLDSHRLNWARAYQ